MSFRIVQTSMTQTPPVVRPPVVNSKTKTPRPVVSKPPEKSEGMSIHMTPESVMDTQ